MSPDFNGRNVIVTGATGELGEAVARRLLDARRTGHIPVRDLERARGRYGSAGDRVRAGAVSDLGDESAVAAYYAGLPPLWASIHCAGGFAMSRIDATALDD